MKLALLAMLFPLSLGLARDTQVPLGIVRTGTLRFGSFVAGPTPGTITISPTGVRSSTGGVTLLSSDRGRPATFVVRGKPNGTYQVIVPPEVTLAQGGSVMRIDGFTVHPERGELSGEVPYGIQTLQLGATLHVAPHQSSGNYQVEFELAVSSGF